MNEPLRIFVGMDSREWVGLPVFCSSVWRRASKPVQITPLGELTPSDGSNVFTISRFLVPQLCGYQGWALFCDGTDMLCLEDIAKLFDLATYAPVAVVKHDYKTRYKRKYLGAKNEDYPRKNWSSLMLMFCGHYAWRNAPLDNPKALHRLSWIPDDQIQALPMEWNYLVGEDNQKGPAKLVHYTIGLPVWEPYDRMEYADEWIAERDNMMKFQPWAERRVA